MIQKAFVLICLAMLTVGCNHSKEYHLKKNQKKKQNFEHKPAVKVTEENLKNKEKNLKTSNKNQQKHQENQSKSTKSKKTNTHKEFKFY